MKDYSTVLFDIDGTLLDTSSGIISSVDYVIEKMGLPEIDQSKKESFIGPIIHDSFRRVYHLDESHTIEAANLFRTHYSQVDLVKAELYDGILELLESLRKDGISLGVATYKRQDYAESILRIFSVSQYFDCIFGSDFKGRLTKQDIINRCVKELGNNKETTLMIGDTDSDKAGAINAGVDFLGVTYGFGFKQSEDNGCVVVNDVKSIYSYITSDEL